MSTQNKAKSKPNEKVKTGRPTSYNPDFHPQSLVELSLKGLVVVQVCREWGIHKDTFYEWVKVHPAFSDAFKLCKTNIEAHFVDIGMMISKGIIEKTNGSVFTFMAKNVVGWADRIHITDNQDVEFDTGEDQAK